MEQSEAQRTIARAKLEANVAIAGAKKEAHESIAGTKKESQIAANKAIVRAKSEANEAAAVAKKEAHEAVATFKIDRLGWKMKLPYLRANFYISNTGWKKSRLNSTGFITDWKAGVAISCSRNSTYS